MNTEELKNKLFAVITEYTFNDSEVDIVLARKIYHALDEAFISYTYYAKPATGVAEAIQNSFVLESPTPENEERRPVKNLDDALVRFIVKNFKIVEHIINKYKMGPSKTRINWESALPDMIKEFPDMRRWDGEMPSASALSGAFSSAKKKIMEKENKAA